MTENKITQEENEFISNQINDTKGNFEEELI